jgi:hypothetical protein
MVIGAATCYHRPMPRKPKLPPDNPEQFKRFIETAREVEVDESPDAVDRAFNRVIRGRSAQTPSGHRNPKSSK